MPATRERSRHLAVLSGSVAGEPARLNHMLWRLLRVLLLLLAGSIAGFAAAAAMLRGWLPSRGDEASDELALVAIFDGIQMESRSEAFHGGSILAWFGGVELDLTEATLAPGARLDLRAAVGGVAIKVPMGWRVDAEATAFVGGVDVSVPEPDDPDAPTLVVRVASVFGGVAISVGSARRAGAESTV